MTHSVNRFAWATAFLATLIAPLLLATAAGHRGGLLLEISLVLGLVATSLFVCVIVMASRPRTLTATLGIERISRVHRYLGITLLTVVLAHTLAVVLAAPGNWALLDLAHAPPRARAATAGTIALILLTALSLLRRRLRLSYRFWRVTHVLLAAGSFLAVALHVVLLRHLVVDPAMRTCFGLLAAAVALMLLNRWVLRPLGIGRRTFRVWDTWVEAGEVITLVLAPAGTHRIGWRGPLRFSPGQFAWIRLRRWGMCTDHPFTIASAPRDDGVIEFTIRRVGDYTHSLARLRPGSQVYLDGPHGSFTADRRPTAEGLVLIAGGVGITPMVSMLRTLADRGDPRRHTIFIGARTPDQLLFTEELADLSRRLDLAVVTTVTRPDDDWGGHTGRIDADLLDRSLPGHDQRQRVDYYVCGSTQFVAGIQMSLHRLRIPLDRIHTEQFEMV